MLFVSTETTYFLCYIRTTQSYDEGLNIFTQLFNTYPILFHTHRIRINFPSLVHVMFHVAWHMLIMIRRKLSAVPPLQLDP